MYRASQTGCAADVMPEDLPSLHRRSGTENVRLHSRTIIPPNVLDGPLALVYASPGEREIRKLVAARIGSLISCR